MSKIDKKSTDYKMKKLILGQVNRVTTKFYIDDTLISKTDTRVKDLEPDSYLTIQMPDVKMIWGVEEKK